MNTVATNASYAPFDIKQMLATMDVLKAAGEFRDAMRDVLFEDLRRRGFYIKAERDSRGEFWVIDDKIIEQVKTVIPQKPVGFLGMPPLGSVRVVALSDWLKRDTKTGEG